MSRQPNTESQAMRLLDPMTMPLTGRSVIEASAGTGKTFTITTLYVRLLLGLDAAELPPLTVDQLLVMTFTEAATEEIRDRVRKRLQEVKDALLTTRDKDPAQVISDPVLRQICVQLTEPAMAFGRIDAALKSLDEAAIFTIHGFCHRMLQQHAFESRSLFEETFIMDETELLQRVSRDYWRRKVPQQQGLVLEVLQASWSHPDKLLKDIRGLLNRQFDSVLPEVSWQTTLTKAERLVEQIHNIKRLWLQSDIAQFLADSDLNARSKALKNEHLSAMRNFCESADLRPGKLDLSAWSVEVLSKPTMLKGSKKPPQHPVFDLISDYLQASATIEDEIKAAFLQSALSEISYRRDLEKQRLQYLSPDDLLTRLAKALQQDTQGLLAAAIRKQFPAMMIDEFQDTDPLQYQIVDSIYPANTNADLSEDSAASELFSLIMIGDPKQAIYGFRGADIFTYIQAKRAVEAPKRFTLGTNWRSSAPMINAVNELFEQAQQGFLYQEDIPFQPVKAAHTDKHAKLQIEQQTAASLHVWHLAHADGPITQHQSKAIITEQLVREVVSLLKNGEQGKATIEGLPIVASDMAVLVRDRNEAKLIREALRKAGVGSVFITRQSVFDSDFALALFQLLSAIYQEKNEASIRSLLVGPFFGFDVQQVLQLNDDEVHWQQLLQQVQRWKQQWLRFGVLAMMQQIIIDNELAKVWREQQWDVERLLTDYRHLGELLQEKSMQMDGAHRLLNWFRQQLQTDQQSEGFRLRLESDEKLVQIVTWHSSKGLEYPIVFLPFAVNYRDSSEVIFHEKQHLVLDLSPRSNFQSQAQKEQLAEDIRLLYVALTRPVYRCYLGIADVKYGNRKASVLPHTAMGSLLNLDPDIKEQSEPLHQSLYSWQQRVNANFERAVVIESIDVSSVDTSGTESAQTQRHSPAITPEYHARTFTGQIHRDWHVTSYSALSHNATSTHIQPGGTDEKSASRLNAMTEFNPASDSLADLDTLLVTEKALSLTAILDPNEWQDIESYASQQNAIALQPYIAQFPKGANAGSCLHYIMENIDFSKADEQLSSVVADALTLYGIDSAWQKVTESWIRQILVTPLFPNSVAKTLFAECSAELDAPNLSMIQVQQRLVEMEFFLPMQRVSASALSQIIQQHLREISQQRAFVLSSAPEIDEQLPQLQFAPVQGILKGFIDLIFCVDGKYFVLDYKSNWLGESFEDYSEPAMHQAMLSHHYHLQYLLYVLALHRFLKNRVPDYQYETHIGGVVYAFLRGMSGGFSTNQQLTGMYYQSPSWAIIEQLDHLFSGSAHSHKKARRTAAQKTKTADSQDEQLSLWDDQISEQWQEQPKRD